MTKSPYYPCLPFTSPKMYPNQKKKKRELLFEILLITKSSYSHEKTAPGTHNSSQE